MDDRVIFDGGTDSMDKHDREVMKITNKAAAATGAILLNLWNNILNDR